MSKTLSIKKLDAVGSTDGFGGKVSFETTAVVPAILPAVPSYTADQLRAMLEVLEPSPPHIVADKSVLPPVEERVSAPIQAPANRHGSFSLNGIAILGSPIAPNINPATGFPHNQVVQAPKGGLISPPPTRNFR